MITLISPRLSIQKSDFLGSGVPYWPLELAVFASFLRERGELVTFYDLFGSEVRTLEEKADHFLQGISIEKILQKNDLSSSQIFVVYAISSMSHEEVLFIISSLRNRYQKPVLVLENSQAVTAYALEERAKDFFSAGATGLLCGEPYWNWEEVAPALQSTSAAVPDNLIEPKNPEKKPHRRINKNGVYPPPAWDLVPFKNYWSLPYSHGPKTKTYFPILTSRGCPYPCDFCVVPATNERLWRGRSPSEVVDEMVGLKEKYGVRDFQIEDLNPTISKARTKEICDLLIARKADLRFYIVSGTKAETVGLDQVELLARAGCRYISISPESGSENVMKAIGKPFDYVHGLALVKKCHDHGIFTQACFVVGHPDETAAAHEASRNYLRDLIRAGLDETAIFILAPLAGSRLAQNGRIELESHEKMVSFSPRGRAGYEILAQKRAQLIKAFFIGKLLRGPNLFAQAIRALFRCPRTKMENLPWRMVCVYRIVIGNKIKILFGG